METAYVDAHFLCKIGNKRGSHRGKDNRGLKIKLFNKLPMPTYTAKLQYTVSGYYYFIHLLNEEKLNLVFHLQFRKGFYFTREKC